MHGYGWDPDIFCDELTARLVATLSGPLNHSLLARAVADCDAAAETVCCERPMACSAGCPYCCVLNVAALLPEAMVISHWLQANLGVAEIEALRKRLDTHGSWARWMDDEERISRKAVCPFLDEACNCFIHQVRPLSCRGVASLDSMSCKEAFNPIISEQDRRVPVDLLRRSAYDAAFKALAQALGHHGMDDRSIELGVGVLAMLERTDCHELFLSRRQLPHCLWE